MRWSDPHVHELYARGAYDEFLTELPWKAEAVYIVHDDSFDEQAIKGVWIGLCDECLPRFVKIRASVGEHSMHRQCSTSTRS